MGLGMLIALAFFPQVEARTSEGPELTGEEPYVAVVDPRDGPDPDEPVRGVLRIRVVTDVGILLIHDGGGTAENPGPPAEYADQWQELDDPGPHGSADPLDYPGAPPEYAGQWQDPDDATALESEEWADEPTATDSEEWASDPTAWEDEEWPAEPSVAESERWADESVAFEPEQRPADQDDVDAASGPEAVDGTSGTYVALWHDFESHRLFVFERPIFDLLDVGHAVVNLERDLGIDAQSLAAEVAVVSNAIDAAWSQDEDATTWERASVEMIEYLLAFDSSGQPDPTREVILIPNDAPYIDCLPVGIGGGTPNLPPGFDDLTDCYTPGCIEGSCRLGTICCARQSCCERERCCPGGCCGLHQECCVDECCEPNERCCDGECCEPGWDCCDDECCDGQCCDLPDGGTICRPYWVVCCGDSYCFPGEQCCERDQGGQPDYYCCPKNGECCEGECCPTDSECCNEDCCNGVCCEPDEDDDWETFCCERPDPCTDVSCGDEYEECFYTERWPPEDPETGCGPNGCELFRDLPPFLHVNNDDDNRNGVPDCEEFGPVNNEDDLRELHVYTAGCPTEEGDHCPDPPSDGVHIHILAEGVNMYKQANKSSRWPGGSDWPVPTTAFAEGIVASTACGVLVCDYRLCNPVHDPPVHCYGRSEPIPVVKVSSLRWDTARESEVQGAGDNLPLDKCRNNGGKRIFPGKLDKDDLFTNARRSVALEAIIEPPISGVGVNFRIWDVDDPFNESHPNMPDVDVIDNDAIGCDNRGASGNKTGSATTDSSGRARMTFTVSRQPGDNFRAAATCLDGVLTDGPVHVKQVDQADADAINTLGRDWSGYKTPVVWSEMLTVWRKLHAETDSMARPTFAENTVTGQWNEPRFIGNQLWVDISDQPFYDDLENGYIRIQAAGFPDLISRIIDHESSAGADPIRTDIKEATWGARPSSGNFVASDDDLGNEALFTAGVVGSIIGVGAPPNGFLLLPDTSQLQEVYEPAYILPVVEPQYTSEGAYPFYKNFRPETKANWDPGRLVLRGLPVSRATFWTVYIFSAFQAEASADCDGEGTGTKGATTHREGSTSPPLLWGDSYTGMAAVFSETLRDGYADVQAPRVVAHEIAHTLGAPHLGAHAIPGDGGLMDETEQGPAFLAESLKTLREYVEP